jgi:alpha-beta hydrolase superfamily lysophospholipase
LAAASGSKTVAAVSATGPLVLWTTTGVASMVTARAEAPALGAEVAGRAASSLPISASTKSSAGRKSAPAWRTRSAACWASYLRSRQVSHSAT